MKTRFLLFSILLTISVAAQKIPFRFAFLTDIHISAPGAGPDEDLRRSVRDINATPGLSFVVITGDITEMGTNEELKYAKQLLDSLQLPYYIIPGNHDSGWSESGGDMFNTVFGDTKFSFEYAGIRFLGCASGPYVRMSDGHVPRSALNWLDVQLKTLKPDQPLIFLNHYPIDNSLDNWYEITNRLHHYNTWAVLCGHGHNNHRLNFEGIPGVMGRSNLRAKAAVGGYNLVEVRTDSILFTEKTPGIEQGRAWTGIPVETHHYPIAGNYTRPDYSINEKYKQVQAKWVYASEANVISTPLLLNDVVIAGNQSGRVVALSVKNGKELWDYNGSGAIFSSPAAAGNLAIVGAAGGNLYALDSKTGKLAWTYQAGAAILGSPLVRGDTVFVGGSDHRFVALQAGSGKLIWSFDGLTGPVVSKPLWYDGKLIFGAWDRHLYALQSSTGVPDWKWDNGSSVRNFSPASCIPVAADGVVYIVAPDRYLSALDAATGKTLWRTKDGGLRESIGISADGRWIYGKSMQDTIVAYAASREAQQAAWKMNCGFGYEHVPSMLIERGGLVFFGTRLGVVYCIDPKKQEIVWAHKIDNSMVNTVNVIDAQHVVAATMDGKVVLLEVK